jgi:carboxyl-terminal processing protease
MSYSTDIGEDSLPNALPWDTIPKADYNELNMGQPYLPQLRKLSDARVATNQDFVYIRQDIDEFTKLQADKTVSLNEREELKRVEQTALSQEARNAERAKRKAPHEKIYEITVENANKPGLPPMLWPTNMVAAATNTVAASALASGLTTTKATIIATATISTNNLPTDPWLDEAEHILEDYVSLMDKNRKTMTNP